MIRWITILVLAACMTAGTTSAWAGYEEGEDAYKQGNYERAFREFHEAAGQGDASSQRALGFMYRNGRGTARNYEESEKWFRKAAEQGDVMAQNHLGLAYNIGLGITQDYAEAVKWYRKAAEQGDASGQDSLGDMYFYGHGITQDYTEAAKWYRKAAEQGYARAQFDLGLMYFDGFGVTQDFVLAHMWLNIATALWINIPIAPGNNLSKESRDFVAKKMTPAQIAEAQRLARECVARNYKNC